MAKGYSSDDIQVLSTVEAIRMRPQLYFDKCFREGTLDSLPFEVLCHAFDEYFDGVCTKIEISVMNDSFTVNYDAGISLELNNDGFSRAESIMTQIFACKNEKKHLAVGEEFCSLGMATINFAAERCELSTICDSKKGSYIFEKGMATSREISIVEGQKEFTTIYIRPDKLLFNNLPFTHKGIVSKAKDVNSKLAGLEISIHNNINPVN